jgi:ribosomal protein S18 acetylase RimI-like enzyme
MSVTVRHAVIGDLDELVPLFDAYRQFYGQPHDLARARAFLRERFANAQSVVFLARDGEGAAVGFTQLYPSFSSTRTARTLVLNDLYVSPEARGSGVGRNLLAAAAAYGRAIGAVELSLMTARTNHTAQRLYESAGWVRDEVFLTYELALA